MKFLFIFMIFTAPFFAEERDDQKAFFQENGYLWVKDFFSEDQVILLKNWAEQINHDAKYRETLIVVPEMHNPLQICRAEDLLSEYPALNEFSENILTTYLEETLGEPYVTFKDKLNFKWPGGGAFLPHQDFPAFEALGPKKHITVMISIDPATLENGCLQVAQNWKETFADNIINSHMILPYVQGGNKHGSIQPDYVDKISWLPLKTTPRDLVLIDSYVPHYSEMNNSNSSRRALFITYNRLCEGEHRKAYYDKKREDPENPVFHFGTPTKSRAQ